MRFFNYSIIYLSAVTLNKTSAFHLFSNKHCLFKMFYSYYFNLKLLIFSLLCMHCGDLSAFIFLLFTVTVYRSVLDLLCFLCKYIYFLSITTFFNCCSFTVLFTCGNYSLISNFVHTLREGERKSQMK